MRETAANNKLTDSGNEGDVKPGDTSSAEHQRYYKWKKLRLQKGNDFPCSRSKHGVCRLGDCVYLFGGKDVTLSLKDLWRYSLERGLWERVRYHGESLPHLEDFTILAHRRLLYIFGGEFSPCQEETPLWVYNTDLLHMRKVCTELGQPHPSGRRDHSAVIYREAMFVYGGFTDVKGSSNELWRFDFESEDWELMCSDPGGEEGPGARHGHSAVVYDKCMWVYGGMTNLIQKPEMWQWSFGRCKWVRVRTKVSPPPLTGHTADVVGDSMFVLGGDNCGHLENAVWRFRFECHVWERIEFPGSVFTSRTCHCTAVVMPPSPVVSETEPSRSVSLPALRRQSHQRANPSERPRTSPAGSARPNLSNNSMLFHNRVFPNLQESSKVDKEEIKGHSKHSAVNNLRSAQDVPKQGEIIELSTFSSDEASVVNDDKELLLDTKSQRYQTSVLEKSGEDNPSYTQSPDVAGNFTFTSIQATSGPASTTSQVATSSITPLAQGSRVLPPQSKKLTPTSGHLRQSLPSSKLAKAEGRIVEDYNPKRRSFHADDLILEDLEHGSELSQLFAQDRFSNGLLNLKPTHPGSNPRVTVDHCNRTVYKDTPETRGSEDKGKHNRTQYHAPSSEKKGSYSYQTTSFSPVCTTARQSTRSQDNPAQTMSDTLKKSPQRITSYIMHDVGCIYVFGGRKATRRELGIKPISVLKCEIPLTNSGR